MKKLFLLITALGAFTASTLTAQEVVTTGIVKSTGQDGSLVVLSDQTHAPVTFMGAASTNIFTVDGSPAQLSDLQMGTKVTVQYAERGGKWFVSKIMFGEAKKPMAAAAAAGAPVINIRPGSGTNPTGYQDRPGPGTVKPLSGVKGP